MERTCILSYLHSFLAVLPRMSGLARNTLPGRHSNIQQPTYVLLLLLSVPTNLFITLNFTLLLLPLHSVSRSPLQSPLPRLSLPLPPLQSPPKAATKSPTVAHSLHSCAFLRSSLDLSANWSPLPLVLLTLT